MIRTHILRCRLPKIEADALNRESGRIYTDTLVWHYRVFRRKGVWLGPYAAMRFGDSRSGTTLHAHSRDAAQQAFYRACKTAKANRSNGAKYPHRHKTFRTTIWKNTGMCKRDGHLLLARARGLEPVKLRLPKNLIAFPPEAFKEARLVYDLGSRHYNWHFVIEDGILPSDPPGDETLAVDLGEIHPMAIANEHGDVVIFTARDLRALSQYRNKRLASLQRAQSKCRKNSRKWRRLQRRKNKLLARNKRQRGDIEHKVTRAVVDHAVEEHAGRVVIGDIRDIADGKRLRAKSQQKIANWSHGRQVKYLNYKLAAKGIILERQDESYSTKTCCWCGAINSPRGRNYKCSACGAVGHRDGNAACNQESKALYGVYGHVQPRSIKYLRPFRRASSSGGHPASSLGLMLQEAHVF